MSALLEVRAFGDAMDRMHSGMKSGMDMNATDLAALRMLIMREQRGVAVSPRDLADHLRISTASTTKLLDRLTESGHLERRPHPRDGRARVVVLTDASRREFFQQLGEKILEMRGAAQKYSEDELAVVTRFMSDVGAVMDSD
ncbi:MarR family transcriptional regulator [Microbacterium sp. P02]|uniref:MarR family transcriptional regulator n=1 Tax=unclassified Microbacterium TaxID=2609290 RepID=UPI00366B9E07